MDPLAGVRMHPGRVASRRGAPLGYHTFHASGPAIQLMVAIQVILGLGFMKIWGFFMRSEICIPLLLKYLH